MAQNIVHSGDWCLWLVLHTPGGACQIWWWSWLNSCHTTGLLCVSVV